MTKDRIYRIELNRLLDDGHPWRDAERMAGEIAERKYHEMADERDHAGPHWR